MGFSERLSALDASFLEIEDESTHWHVGAVLVLDARPLQRPDGSLDIDRIRDFVESRLPEIPRYRQRLAYIPLENHPVWVDDPDFNLLYHVRHTALPSPGDERLLKRLTGRVVSQKLDRGKPLWELWVVEGLQGDRFALIAKVHHCMIDGISGVDMLATLLRPVCDASAEPPGRWMPRPGPSRVELAWLEARRRAAEPWALATAGLRALRSPFASARSAWEALGAVGEVFGTGLRPASETPFNPPRIGPHRRFDWARFDLGDVKEVKRTLGGTVNDVVLTTVAGAVGEFLRSRMPLDGIDFRAMVPVNVRPSSTPGHTGNHVGMLVAPLPVEERAPRERIRRVIDTMQRLKRSGQVRGGEIIEELGDWTATAVITQGVRLTARVRTFNLVVTNVPGPQVPLYLLDAPLLEIYPVLPLYSNQALGVALFSYNGGLHWGFNSDWDRVPELHDLVELFGVEFERLRKEGLSA